MKTSVPIVHRTATYYSEYVAKRIREQRGGVADEPNFTSYNGKDYVTLLRFKSDGTPMLLVWPIPNMFR